MRMINAMLGDANVLLWVAAEWAIQALELMGILQPYPQDHLAVEDGATLYMVTLSIGSNK